MSEEFQFKPLQESELQPKKPKTGLAKYITWNLGISLFALIFFCAACSRQEKSIYTYYVYKPDWNSSNGIAAKWSFNTSNNESEYTEFLFDKTTGEAVSFKRTCDYNLDITEKVVTIDDGSNTIQIDLNSDFLPSMGGVNTGLQTDLSPADFSYFNQSNGMTSRIELLQPHGYSRCH